MPQIIVTADETQDVKQMGVTLRERINVDDFESDRFAANLVERLGWAVLDAAEVELPRPTRTRSRRTDNVRKSDHERAAHVFVS